MKKIIAIAGALLVLSSAAFTQVLSKNGVQNTLSTTVGLPYGEAGSAHRAGVRFYGFVETLQARVDISKFTLEGMLNWGALTSWNGNGTLSSFYFANTKITPFWYTNHFDQGGWWTNGEAESYYVNFVFHPLKGLDMGAGTRLEWKIGPAPASYGNYWEPFAHIVQGGLKDAVPGGADVAGYTYYANNYTAHYSNNTKASLAVRYCYEELLEVGIAIPSGVTTSAPFFNAAFKIHPVDMLTLSIAYEGILQASGNLYTGVTLKFRPVTVEGWLGIDFHKHGDWDLSDQRWGTGAAVTIAFSKVDITIRPEGGLSFYTDSHYSPAWYVGGRFDWQFQEKFNLGAWSSFAVGSSDNRWGEGWSGGFVFDMRPDFTWKIDASNSLTAFFDFQNRKAYNGVMHDVWATGVYWTFRK